MEFKTNRLYYILSKKFGKQFLLRFASYASISLIWILLYGAKNLDMLVFVGVFVVLSLVFDIFSKPSKFKIEDNYVSLKVSIRIPTGYKNRHTTKQVNAKILDIDVIQYKASPLEKSNRVGKIAIHGRVVARDFFEDYVEAEHLPSYVEIYGVKNFESAVSALKTTFPDAILQEL